MGARLKLTPRLWTVDRNIVDADVKWRGDSGSLFVKSAHLRFTSWLGNRRIYTIAVRRPWLSHFVMWNCGILSVSPIIRSA